MCLTRLLGGQLARRQRLRADRPSGCEAARRGVFSVDCSSEMSADRFLAVFEGV